MKREGVASITEIRKFLVGLLPQAGDILRRYSSGQLKSFSKGGVDFATEADVAVDRFLQEKIANHLPFVQFLTEETAPSDYMFLQEAHNLIIIDPLDGTTNFSRKNSHCAISVAFVHRGITKVGVVYMLETGETYWAQEDVEGAYRNEERIHVSTTVDIKQTVVACDWSWDLQKRMIMHQWLGNILPHVRAVKSMGSAVADLAGLANGQIDVYIHSGLKPWDVAASSFFVQKAGGIITTPEGDVWNIFHPAMLAANSKVLHEKMSELIHLS